LSEVCHDVKVEHYLQPLTGETLRYRTAVSGDDAHLDIRAVGFWGDCFQHVFLCTCLNSLAPPNMSSTLTAAYCRHEQEKHRAYEERVQEVEHGCFTPLVFSTGKAATVVYKCLAHLLSTHHNASYTSVMGWLRCTLSFLC